ncbi:MAG: DEAD/DEAH box helicase family protein [Methanophagales archaeon]|nr:DEAD/DEAH box helicase family protein [Methanophagales archaeon]
MVRKNGNFYSQLYLAETLKGEVDAWVKEGYPGVTQTTYELLHYWFDREEKEEGFYDCQRRAIETVIYCHEILQIKNLGELFQKVVPDLLYSSKPVYDEVTSIPFPKYCFKMATGTGKTWVLIALLIWQYFNALNKEKPHGASGETKDWYSYRFLLTAPNIEVLNRLLDAFKGKRDPETGLRNPQETIYYNPLFIPEDWRFQFHLQLFEPNDVKANTSPPETAFIFLTNWQQFRLKKEAENLWVGLTGEDIEEEPRGEIIADFLSEFPDLVIMNDEAHHVHGKKTAKNEELVWRRFINVLYQRLEERHEKEKGVFIQFDFSATPFFGSGAKKEYFPHIVYDYPLLNAMNDMLVKQLFLEERQAIAGENLRELDFRAEREEPEKGKKKGAVIGLSAGQKVLLEIGRKKLEQLTEEFRAKGVEKKPVLMVLCEETEVADLVERHFYNLTDNYGIQYDERKAMKIHTKLTSDELDKARKRLDKIDVNRDPLNVVISVLMLREGFDRKNICVTVVLRATEADLLLEQIVGRGLRLMFPKEEYPEIGQAKVEAVEDIKRNKIPSSSFDFLFIVEHPRFRQFYENLRKEGYLIGTGDTSRKSSTGDLISVDAIPTRLEDYDIYWPVQIYDQSSMPDLSKIDSSTLPKYSFPEGFSELREKIGKLVIQEIHTPTEKKTKIWKLENKYFDYNHFLSRAAQAVAKEGKTHILTGHLAEIAAIIDDYVSNYFFSEAIDFSDPGNYQVLNFALIFDQVVNSVRNAILKIIGEITYETRGVWNKLSDVGRIMLREKYSVESSKCIYPRQGFSSIGGGFERDFMLDVLEPSVDVKAYAKLDKKHALRIPYRDEHSILREYEVDFVVKTTDKMYLVETKADRDLDKPTTAIKAKAAQSWCRNASLARPTDVEIEGIDQPLQWEYLLLSESLFNSNRGQSFESLVPLCRVLTNQIIAEQNRRGQN